MAGVSGTTTGGTLALTDLGAFTLQKPSQGADPYHSNDTFTLGLIFLAPGGVVGQSDFTATLAGTVNTQSGSVAIDFDSTRTFTFSNPAGSGLFDLTINDLTLALPHDDSITSVSATLTGIITQANDPPTPTPVPEPFSIALLGTMIVGVIGRMRARPAGK